MSHTPAPWTAKKEAVWNADEVMYVAAKNFDTISPSQTLEANARLIAAAPDLLDALEWLVQDEPADSAKKGVIYARAVIAKARGG